MSDGTRRATDGGGGSSSSSSAPGAAGSASLKDYIARTYLSGPAADRALGKKPAAGPGVRKAKKKGKVVVASATTRVIDEDADWDAPAERGRGRHRAGGDGDDAPTVAEVQDVGARFKSTSWVTLSDGAGAGVSAASQAGGHDGDDDDRPRRRRRSPTPSDDEAPRRRRQASPSPSPSPSRGRQRSGSADAHDSHGDSNGDALRMEDGTLAGLQTGEALRRHQQDKERHQRERFAMMDDKQLGKGAATVYRDKQGRKVDLAAEQAAQAAAEREREAQEQERMVWGGGIAQHKAAADLARRIAQEESAPLAVYADDHDRNREMREQSRWGDPMAFMRSSGDGGGQDQDGKSGKKRRQRAREVYKGPPPEPNRFGIPPGYRWDGVDRSNGFERAYFQKKHARNVLSEEAYKWSTENM
ncbi:Pre-mRNA-splicing factor cwc26 [Polyrhizophydium stewartii]|uniref:Pre-mRNA-splicing factor cwc26 n=1 Tax=Polyrhizophydium stewartii TaxID=2732419 RepID=A0ABR4MXM5_9FUNG